MDLKQYMVDTNSVRYRVNKAEAIHKPARRFWNKALEEVQSGEAVILVPQEVVRELKNQSFSFTKFKNKPELENIAELLSYSEMIPNITSGPVEELIIEMTAFVTAEYREELLTTTNVSKLKYPSIPDARILCTAWQRDCVMVTANISDFVLLLLLEAPNEEKLYNILTASYIKIPEKLHAKIHSDEVFQSMFQQLVEKIESL